MKPDDEVQYRDDESPFPQVGTVKDHAAAEMTPPDAGVVLVAWGRSTLSWEYASDLVVRKDARP